MIKIFKHRDIEFEDIVDICELKGTHWIYTVYSQLDWMNQNLSQWDYHFMLYKPGLIGYLQLSQIVFYVDNVLIKGDGIGNVIVKEKGKGYGRELMTTLKNHIQKGLLFCQPKMVDFYSKYGWTVVEKDKCILKFKRDGVVLMSYGLGEFEVLKYEGKEF